MDRNTVLGLVLIAGIVLTWSIFFTPKNEPKDADPQTRTTTDSVVPGKPDPTPFENTDEVAATPEKTGFDVAQYKPRSMDDSTWKALPDSTRMRIARKEQERRQGRFHHLAGQQPEWITVSTDRYDLKLTTKGGYVSAMKLKEYQTYDSMPLPIVPDIAGGSRFGLTFTESISEDIKPYATDTLAFTNVTGKSGINLTGDQSKEIVLALQGRDGVTLEYVYTFYGDRFDYDFKIRQKGFEKAVIASAGIVAHWQSLIPKTEKAVQLMLQKTAIYFHESDAVEWVNPNSENNEEIIPENKVDWFAFKSQFFSHTLLTADAGESLNNLKLFQTNIAPADPENPNDVDFIKTMQASFELPGSFATQNGAMEYKFFAGPLDVDVLRKYGRNMIYQIELGWGPLKWVNRYGVIPVFNFLENFFSNYGLIILILAFLIKLILYPLTYKTYISTAKMRVINQTPEIKALEDKYKDEPTKLQQEKMLIYRQMGVNMLGGCWPMLLQYPFLIALFFFFPNSIELRQESFLWAEDLSTYDSILDLPFTIPFYGDHVSLFTLLMTISIFVFTIINQRMQGTVATNPVMKYFPYIMPVIFLGFLNNYSAGLSWYYLLSNLISITQTMVTKRFINEEKLLTQMRETAKQRKKGKKGKSRIERWAETQQKKQRQMQKARSGRGRGGKKRR